MIVCMNVIVQIPHWICKKSHIYIYNILTHIQFFNFTGMQLAFEIKPQLWRAVLSIELIQVQILTC